MSKFVDFDAAIAEAGEEPVVVRYLGHDWTLFSSLPAKPVMRLLRLQADGRGANELRESEMIQFMSEMVPADVLEAWLDGGMTIEQMATLLKAILDAYRGTDEEDDSGETPAPEPGPPTSSSTTLR